MTGFDHLRDPVGPPFIKESEPDATGSSTHIGSTSWFATNRGLGILIIILAVLLVVMFSLLGVFLKKKK